MLENIWETETEETIRDAVANNEIYGSYQRVQDAGS